MLSLQEVGTRKVVSGGGRREEGLKTGRNKISGGLFNMRRVSVPGVKTSTYFCTIPTEKATLLRPSVRREN